MKKSEDLEGKVWQYFTVVPDFISTGIHTNYLRKRNERNILFKSETITYHSGAS